MHAKLRTWQNFYVIPQKLFFALLVMLVMYGTYHHFLGSKKIGFGQSQFLPTKSLPAIGGIRTNKKVIAISFDDGPSEKYTKEVLDILQKYNIKATFFVMGGNVKLYPDVLKATFAAGNVIGNHSFSHPYFTGMSENAIERDLIKTNKIIYDTIHVYPTLFRPPFGIINGNLKQATSKLGLKIITWNYMVNDYDISKTTSEKIATLVLNNAHPGAIMNMHDGNGDRSKTVAALPKIIVELQKRGYEFLTVPELLNVAAYQNK
jgi:peptidoglycan/xylan/chitin deacetylase (PgdA/CDA1 family)